MNPEKVVEGRDKIKSGMKSQSQGTWRTTYANKNLIKGNEERKYRKVVKRARERVAEKDPKETAFLLVPSWKWKQQKMKMRTELVFKTITQKNSPGWKKPEYTC